MREQRPKVRGIPPGGRVGVGVGVGGCCEAQSRRPGSYWFPAHGYPNSRPQLHLSAIDQKPGKEQISLYCAPIHINRQKISNERKKSHRGFESHSKHLTWLAVAPAPLESAMELFKWYCFSGIYSMYESEMKSSGPNGNSMFLINIPAFYFLFFLFYSGS